ncbi:GNAT family N-acetyltransferase [Bacillus salitolerans]|uniref:GNAT family N-acetyltransferase n=1 Tax=Bacillus salitolerans TaxID=1437434 RepID=A0ABW4LJN7_9BACI
MLFPMNEEYIGGIVKLWNKELGDSFPMRAALFKQNSLDDVNVLKNGSLVALNQSGEVIGFVIVKIWSEEIGIELNKEIGWIQALLVDSNYRNRGIGSTLLERAEKELVSKQIKIIRIGSDPWHYFPGIPSHCDEAMSWFEKKGYKNDGKEYDLVCQYNEARIDPVPQFVHVTFGLLKIEEKIPFLSFMNRCFPGRWEYEAISYFERGGTGREFVILKRENELIGFCRINDDDSPFIAQNVYWSPAFETPLGGIGPLGIDPEERKKGYGIAIVEAGIAYLRKRNIHQIIIDWTGLVDFYGKLGYEVRTTYLKYSKRMGGSDR